MSNYIDSLISNYRFESQMNKIVYEITSSIKDFQDYDEAIKIILSNNLKLEDIVLRTVRLSFKDVVKLADKLISIER